MFLRVLLTFAVFISATSKRERGAFAQDEHSNIHLRIAGDVLPRTLVTRMATEGLNLTCSFVNESVWQTYNLSWKVPLNSVNRSHIVPYKLNNGIIGLQFFELEEYDSGDYTCQVTEEPYMLATARLTVKPFVNRSTNRSVYCGSRMFVCPEGPCVPDRYLCDGRRDCRVSGADESPSQCSGQSDVCRDKIRCSDGRCIPREWCCRPAATIRTDTHNNNSNNCTTRVRPACCDERQQQQDGGGHHSATTSDRTPPLHVYQQQQEHEQFEGSYLTKHQQQFSKIHNSNNNGIGSKPSSELDFLHMTIYTIIACALALTIIVLLLVTMLCKAHFRETRAAHMQQHTRHLSNNGNGLQQPPQCHVNCLCAPATPERYNNHHQHATTTANTTTSCSSSANNTPSRQIYTSSFNLSRLLGRYDRVPYHDQQQQQTQQHNCDNNNFIRNFNTMHHHPHNPHLQHNIIGANLCVNNNNDLDMFNNATDIDNNTYHNTTSGGDVSNGDCVRLWSFFIACCHDNDDVGQDGVRDHLTADLMNQQRSEDLLGYVEDDLQEDDVLLSSAVGRLFYANDNATAATTAMATGRELHEFVGQPVSPPPYSETLQIPPKIGPPPPYVSVENLVNTRQDPSPIQSHRLNNTDNSAVMILARQDNSTDNDSDCCPTNTPAASVIPNATIVKPERNNESDGGLCQPGTSGTNNNINTNPRTTSRDDILYIDCDSENDMSSSNQTTRTIDNSRTRGANMHCNRPYVKDRRYNGVSRQPDTVESESLLSNCTPSNNCGEGSDRRNTGTTNIDNRVVENNRMLCVSESTSFESDGATPAVSPIKRTNHLGHPDTTTTSTTNVAHHSLGDLTDTGYSNGNDTAKRQLVTRSENHLEHS